MIQDNITQILGRIQAICQKIGRNPDEITVVAVTKFADISQVKESVAAGLMHMGENKVQEAGKKFLDLQDSGVKVTTHMIGHLQTNKVKQALEIFDCIQSVDSLKLAEAIEKQAAEMNKTIEILIQVNTSGEEQKFGIAPREVLSLVEAILPFKHLHLNGLMAIAPLVEDKEIIRKCFRDLRVLRDAIAQKFLNDERVEMKYLSMGMTQDFEIALEEGANMIRIGSAIFNQ